MKWIDKAQKFGINRLTISAVLGPSLFLIFRGLFQDSNSGIVMGTLMWMLVWWLLEAIPLGITALLPLAIFSATKVSDFAALSRSYGNEVLFLFLGGFILSIALEKTTLIQRLSRLILLRFQGSAKLFLLGLMLCVFLLSMWVSNTAATLILLPLVLFVTKNRKGPFEKAALLGVAYAASVGGTATLIGSPTNPLTAQFLKEAQAIEVNFLTWFKVSILFSISGLILLWLFLSKDLHGKMDNLKDAAFSVYKPKIAPSEWAVLTIFAAMISAWVFSGPLDWSDTVISLTGGIALFLIPNLLGKDDVRALPWEVFLLFGGGIALAQGIQNSHLTADFLAFLDASGILEWNTTLLLFLVTLLIILFTELASNTATVSLFVPILGPMAAQVSGSAIPFYFAICYAASLSFMMPMATPPNAIAFSSGAISIKEMIRVGWKLNLIFAVWITIYCSFVLPLLMT